MPLLQTRVPGTVGAEEFENHPLLRKYYLADRDRDRAQLRGDLQLGEQVTMGGVLAWSKDDYRNSVFGLTRAALRSFTLDLSYAPSDGLTLTAFNAWDRYESTQRGRAFNNMPAQAADPARDWSVQGIDRYYTSGLTVDVQDMGRHAGWLRGSGVTRSLDAGVELLYSRSQGRVGMVSGAALESAPLPDLYSRLQQYRLYASYPLSERSVLRAAWSHERYLSHDFALDSTAPATMASVISLGTRSPRYAVHWIALSWFTSF